MSELEELNKRRVDLEAKIMDGNQEDLEGLQKLIDELDLVIMAIDQADQPPAIEEAPETEIPELVDPDDVDPDDVAPGLDIDVDENGNPVVVPVTPSPFVFELVTLYEHRDVWAEEGGALKENSAQFSYGNGSTGYIGLPFGEGWEIETVYAQADTANAEGSFTIDVVNVKLGADPKEALCSIEMEGGGEGNSKSGCNYHVLDKPVSIPDCAVVGFITRSVKGKYSDVRVGFRARKAIGQAVGVKAS